MRVVLIDDEALANRRLEILLEDHPSVEVVASVTSGRAGLEAVERLRPDVVFLDVEMPEMSGFQTLEALGEEHLPVVVFVTAYPQFAVEAFEREAIDYLMKPVERERLQQCLTKVKRRLEANRQMEDHRRILSILKSHQNDNGQRIWEEVEASVRTDEGGLQTLMLSFGDERQEVRVVNIDWIEAERDYLLFHCGKRRALMKGTMAEMEERLTPSLFQRVHRSAIVNVNSVVSRKRTTTGGGVLVLKDGTEVRIGRKYSAAVVRRFDITSV